jgi:opacity protein-like surface antigen
LKRALFVLIICCSSRLAAQQDPEAYVSLGRGWKFNPYEEWKLDLNASLCAGYRLWPHGLVLAYLDYNGFSLNAGSYTVYRRTVSMLAGAKASMAITDSPVSPYFMGALGFSHITSSSDTVFAFGSSEHNRSLFHVGSGNTMSFLAAVGVDVAVYRNFLLLLEIRTTFGVNTSLYDGLVQYRTGIGITL